MGFGPGMMGGGFSIIFWIVIIGVAYYFFKEYNRKNNHRHDDRRNGGPSGYKGHNNFDNHRDKFNKRKEIEYKNEEDSAEKIARERYAKGEISKAELREILDNLS
jgi:putative membrane protein